MRMKSGIAVREYVNYVCDELQVPQVSQTINIEWNNRLTRVMGSAQVLSYGVGENRSGFTGHIKLASKIFLLAEPRQQEETIVHEVCHIVARYLNPQLVTAQGLKGHGAFWSSLMRKVGFEPNRFLCVNTRSIRKKVNRVIAYCQCSNPWQITQNRATNMMKGFAYRCTKCRFLLSLNDLRKV